MKKVPQVNKIINFLKLNPKEKHTAREIAKGIVNLYSKEYDEKRKNPRFEENENAFITQIVAEIGARKNQILNKNEHIFLQDKPRPRLYWFNPDETRNDKEVAENIEEDTNKTEIISNDSKSFTEQELYPILIKYLSSELNLNCQRIDEKTSSNTKGAGGNEWLHPDIVALETIDKEWDDLIRTCIKQGSGQSVKLWSFEVKLQLTGGNVRKSFFQTVSNSSWANEGYLVTTNISNFKVEQELRMLSALHGIGLILLNPDNPSESEIMLPAKFKQDVDWESINRILKENKDFEDFIELVSSYYQTGRIKSKDWNKC